MPYLSGIGAIGVDNELLAMIGEGLEIFHQHFNRFMVMADIVDEADIRAVAANGAVAFIGFNDADVAFVIDKVRQSRPVLIIFQKGAVNHAGIFPQAIQDETDHGGCGAFAAGTADGNAVSVLVEDFRQQFGALFIGMFLALAAMTSGLSSAMALETIRTSIPS